MGDNKNMDKRELAQYVEKLQTGDISAFEVIYNETNNQVYNLLYSYTKNEYTSLDLMQETYLTVNSKIGTIKDPSAIKSWINRIAINKANRFFEKSKKEILLSEEGQSLFETQLEEDEEFLPQEILDSKEKQKIIKDIIDNLPIEQKTAIYLYYFDELSLSEVAVDMECSEGTVKSRLNYARKKIKVEVDAWRKSGTKLYGTGIPVLLLILREQLDIENISLDKADIVLKNILASIGGSAVTNTISESASNRNKLGNNLGATAKGTGTSLAVKIVTGVIATVLIGSLAYFYAHPKKNASEPSKTTEVKELAKTEEKNEADRSYGNTINNLYKKNQVAEYNGYFYYSSEDKNGLYKAKANGENKEKLNDDNAAFINIYKDHIYYVSKIDGTFYYDLIQVDLDGVSNKTVIAKETTSAYISDDKLMYTIHDSTDKNGKISITAKEKDLTTGEIKDINTDANTFRILGGNRFINTIRGVDKYIKTSYGRQIPNSTPATINLISANNQYIVAEINSYGEKDADNKAYENSVYCIGFNGENVRLGEVALEQEKFGQAIMVDSKFYYWKDGITLDCVDTKDNNFVTSLLSSRKLLGELFEFDGIIYTFVNDTIMPIYDTKNQKLSSEAEVAKEQMSSRKDIKRDFMSQEEAKELVLKQDGNFINNEKKINSTELKYSGLGNSGDREQMEKHWGIKPNSTAYYFHLGNDEGDSAEYYVDATKKEVYRLPPQGGISAYLMEDNNIIVEFTWLD